jgi:hypothetical protein
VPFDFCADRLHEAQPEGVVELEPANYRAHDIGFEADLGEAASPGLRNNC